MPSIRARDIRAQLQGNADPKVMHILEALAEQQHQLEKNSVQMALMLDKITDILPQFLQVAENMKTKIKELTTEDPNPELSQNSTEGLN